MPGVPISGLLRGGTLRETDELVVVRSGVNYAVVSIPQTGSGGVDLQAVQAAIDAGVFPWARTDGGVQVIPLDHLPPGFGVNGADGRYEVDLYLTADSLPAVPTAQYDGANFTGLGDWTDNPPASIPDGERLYKSVATWIPANSTLTGWSAPFPVSGLDGTDGGGGGLNAGQVTALIAPWAREGQSKPTGRTGGKVLQNLQADLSGLDAGYLYYVISEGAIFELRTHQNVSGYPWALTFPLTELRSGVPYVYRGFADVVVSNYANRAQGSIAAAPNVTAVDPDGIAALVHIANAEGSQGEIFIIMKAASEFVPERLELLIDGQERTISGFHEVQRSSTFVWYAPGAHLSAEYANVWGIEEGQSADVSLRFNMYDAAGVSYATATETFRTLERLGVQGEQSSPAGGGAAFTPYGGSEQSRCSEGMLLQDTDNGDSYYSKRVPETRELIVEPFRQGGDAVGLSGGDQAALGRDVSFLNSFVAEGGEVHIGADATELAALKEVLIYGGGSPDAPADGRRYRTVARPAGLHPAEEDQKSIALKTFADNAAKITPAVDGERVGKTSDGGTLTGWSAGDQLWYNNNPGIRRLYAEVKHSDHADRHLRVYGQRLKFEVHSNGAEFNISQSLAGEQDNPHRGSYDNNFAPPLYFARFPLVGQNFDVRCHLPMRNEHTANSDTALALFIQEETEDDPPIFAEMRNIDNPILLLADSNQFRITSHNLPRFAYHAAPGAVNAQLLVNLNPDQDFANTWYRVAVAVLNRRDDPGFRPGGSARSWIPAAYKTLEINGVGIELERNRGVMEEIDSDNAGITYRQRSATYSSGQLEPLVDGEEAWVNMVTENGLMHAPYRALERAYPQGEAARVDLINAQNGSLLTPGGDQFFWRLRNRGGVIPEVQALPAAPGAYDMVRYYGKFYRAMPETLNGLRGVVEAISGGDWEIADMQGQRRLEVSNQAVTIKRMVFEPGARRFVIEFWAESHPGAVTAVIYNPRTGLTKELAVTGQYSTSEKVFYWSGEYAEADDYAVGAHLIVGLKSGNDILTKDQQGLIWRPV